MSPRELAAFRAGILHAPHVALIAAMDIEMRPDARKLRHKSALAALRALAERLKEQGAPGGIPFRRPKARACRLTLPRTPRNDRRHGGESGHLSMIIDKEPEATAQALAKACTRLVSKQIRRMLRSSGSLL